jgi:serine/threonine-protein kinase
VETVYRFGTVLLGKYRVDGEIARSRMGVVLKVHHLHLGEDAAMKILSPEAAASPEIHARFRWETQSVLQLRGPHVARVIDVGLLPDGAPYVVMEYLRGLDLAHELDRRGPLAVGEAVDYVLQACGALAEAHAHGLVHRNIKPSNLFLTARPDGPPVVKVLDFGLSTAGTAGDAAGAWKYMAPEQMTAIDDVDPRTDVWALGVVLYECLTGRRPFKPRAHDVGEPPPMDARIPAGLQAVVLHCLESDRSMRPPSVAALATALASFAHDPRAAASLVEDVMRASRGGRSAADSAPHAATPLATTWQRGAAAFEWLSLRRRSAALGVIALLVLIVAILTAVLIGSSGPRSTEAVNEVGAERAAASSTGSGARAQGAPHSVTPAAPAPSKGSGASEEARKAAACTELLAQRKWRALEDCASELDQLGGSDQAKEFRATASQEALNEAEDAKVRQALRDGDLKAAETSLQLITADSVYFAPLREAFGKAETRAIEDARRSAQSLVAEHDCKGLKRLIAQLAATASERVAAAASVRCGKPDATARDDDANRSASARAERARTADATAGERRTTEARGAEARGAEARTSEPRIPDAKASEARSADTRAERKTAEPRTGDSRAAEARTSDARTSDARTSDARTSDARTSEVRASEPRTSEVRASEAKAAEPSKGCDKVRPDELMIQAATHYDAGHAKTALSLATVALHCKQTGRMYWLTVLYACAAHDLASAKLYFREVPANIQAGVERKCQEESLDVRSR